MLEINVPSTEFYDEEKEEFVNVKGTVLRLEHSLVSISKWESKWKIPFLYPKPKTQEQTLDYIKCMTISQNINPNVYLAIPNSEIKKIESYISETQSATTFKEWKKGLPNRQIITSELIYFWMAQYNIPFECQKWHLSRLMALIRIANMQNSADNKKMSKNAILSQNSALNAARRAKMNTRG